MGISRNEVKWQKSKTESEAWVTFTAIVSAAVAQWIHLRLPSCRPGFESQAHHLCFYQFKFEFKTVTCWNDENKQKKRPGLAILKIVSASFPNGLFKLRQSETVPLWIVSLHTDRGLIVLCIVLNTCGLCVPTEYNYIRYLPDLFLFILVFLIN